MKEGKMRYFPNSLLFFKLQFGHRHVKRTSYKMKWNWSLRVSFTYVFSNIIIIHLNGLKSSFPGAPGWLSQ